MKIMNVVISLSGIASLKTWSSYANYFENNQLGKKFKNWKSEIFIVGLNHQAGYTTAPFIALIGK